MTVIRTILVLIGLGLAAGGGYFLLNLPPGNGFERFLPAGMMFFFAALMFAVFVPMVSGVDHGKLLRTGTPGTATIVAVRDTGNTINQQPVFRFTLDVQTSTGNVRTTVKQLVSRPAVGTLRPGMVVPVRYDPDRPARAAIDSNGTAAGAGSAGVPFGAGGVGSPGGVGGPGGPATRLAGAPAAGGGMPPIAGVRQSEDVIREGVAATATVRAVSLTGTTLGQLQPAHAGGAGADDPMVVLTLDVAGAGGTAFGAQGVYRVPQDRMPLLSPGATVPVVYLPADPANTTCVDWDRLPAG